MAIYNSQWSPNKSSVTYNTPKSSVNYNTPKSSVTYNTPKSSVNYNTPKSSVNYNTPKSSKYRGIGIYETETLNPFGALDCKEHERTVLFSLLDPQRNHPILIREHLYDVIPCNILSRIGSFIICMAYHMKQLSNSKKSFEVFSESAFKFDRSLKLSEWMNPSNSSSSSKEDSSSSISWSFLDNNIGSSISSSVIDLLSLSSSSSAFIICRMGNR
ncbi:hypothetical protein Avbf_14170 [Armadillidium vulgare]|nr:hypothetical protein Avbf_14170 [Armadillidium vulgare]